MSKRSSSKELAPHPGFKSQEEFLAWIDKTTQERSQLESDRHFDGPLTFEVSVPKDPAQPTIRVKAADDDQAETRYRRLCGITSMDWECEVDEVKPGRKLKPRKVAIADEELETADAV